jgi:hypothetical protein
MRRDKTAGITFSQVFPCYWGAPWIQRPRRFLYLSLRWSGRPFVNKAT